MRISHFHGRGPGVRCRIFKVNFREPPLDGRDQKISSQINAKNRAVTSAQQADARMVARVEGDRHRPTENAAFGSSARMAFFSSRVPGNLTPWSRAIFVTLVIRRFSAADARVRDAPCNASAFNLAMSASVQTLLLIRRAITRPTSGRRASGPGATPRRRAR